MDICLKCGNLFDLPITAYGIGGEDDEGWAVCPECGSQEFEEATQCPVCKEWVIDTFVVEEGKMRIAKYVCKECFKENWNPETFVDFLESDKLEKNDFLDFLFEDEKMKEVLFDYFSKLSTEEKKKLMEEYDCKSVFADWLEKQHEE